MNSLDAPIERPSRAIFHNNMVCIVWLSWPQSHVGLSLRPHLDIMEPHRPWPVRILFSTDHTSRGKSVPSTPLFWSVTRPLFFTFVDVQFSRHSFVPSKFDSANSLAVLHGGFLDFKQRLGVFLSAFGTTATFSSALVVVQLSSASQCSCVMMVAEY